MIDCFAPLLTVLADAVPAGGDPAGAPPSGGLAQMLPMFVGIGLIFYFMIIRPGKREKQEREEMLSAIKKGDRIVTKGGLIGRVAEIRDKEYVVKVDESNNTRVHIYKSFVLQVLRDEKDKGAEEKPAA